MTLKTFACDHRNLQKRGVVWKFPFERIGTGFDNDCKLKDIVGDSICTDETNKFLSEYTAIWWMWKHYADIGNPDYVGFIHYRRFFTYCMNRSPLCNVMSLSISGDNVDDKTLALIPDDAALARIIDIQSNAYDGLLPACFPDYSYCKGCVDVVDLMYAESCWYDMHLGFTYDMCKQIFIALRNAMSQHFSEEQINAAFNAKSTFHFNMFILKRELFFLYSQIMEKTVFSCMDILKPHRDKLDARALSYAIERFSSCIFIAMFASKIAKFGMLPIFMFQNKEFLK